MDPSACWNEIVELLNEERAADDATIARIYDLAESLNNWLLKGGFIPKELTKTNLNRSGIIRLCDSLMERYTL